MKKTENKNQENRLTELVFILDRSGSMGGLESDTIGGFNSVLEKQISDLIGEIHPHYMSIPGIGPLSAAVIYAEYGDISNFSSPAQMLAFAGLEPGISESGTESHKGRMVKRGSSQLRYVLMNCSLPLIRFDMTFATYYAKKRAEGKPHRVAMSHVAKKLVRVIFALERQNIDFTTQALR